MEGTRAEVGERGCVAGLIVGREGMVVGVCVGVGVGVMV